MTDEKKKIPDGAKLMIPTSKMVIKVFPAGADPKKDQPRTVVKYPLSRGKE